MNQSPPPGKTERADSIWDQIREEARVLLGQEPAMSGLVITAVMNQARLEDALTYRLAYKLAGPEMSAMALRDVFSEALEVAPELGALARTDLEAVRARDPACHRYLQPLLYFKGFLSIQAARASNALWNAGRRELAAFLQMRVSEVFAADFHPAARIGRGLMIDHLTGVVVGETAVIGNDVSMLHGVTLGGTGKEQGDRHPKIGRDVLIGAGASILGNIHIGDGCRVGAGSVVLRDVPAGKTVAGVPARIVGVAGSDSPSAVMDHSIELDEGYFLGENI